MNNVNTKAKAKNWLKKLFPQTKLDWKMYFIKTLPIIFGEILFCVNGFLDNFMVSHIPYGIDGLTFANTWTGIIFTIFFAIQGIVAMFVGQYYGKGEYDKVRQVMNIRVWIYLFIVIFFCLPAWINPTAMIKAAGGKNISLEVIKIANNYLLLITISWVLNAYVFNTNMLLNEVGHSNFALISSILSLLSNASINAIFLYGFKKPAYYAAIGSIISTLVCTISDLSFAFSKDRKIFLNPFGLFHISRPIAKQIFKRIPSMLLMITAMGTLPIRTLIWARSFPENSIGKKWMGISGITILGLVESLSSIASAVTSACSSNVSYFVASKLGTNEYEEAEKHAYALKGFHTLCGIILSILMIGIVYSIAYSSLTSGGISQNVENYFKDKNNLDAINKEFSNPEINESFIQTRINEAKLVFRNNFLYSCFTFIVINPLWCWFYTVAALIRAGGKPMVSSITTLVANILSFIWLIIIGFVFVKNYPLTFNLPLSYFLFYLFDFVRLIIFEIVLYKFNWKQNITLETQTSKAENTINV